MLQKHQLVVFYWNQNSLCGFSYCMFFTRASNSIWCEMASEQRNLSAVSKLNGNQMICTGSCLVFLAGGVLTLGHVLGNEDHQYLLSFLKLGIVYWTSCTVSWCVYICNFNGTYKNNYNLDIVHVWHSFINYSVFINYRLNLQSVFLFLTIIL